jgi:aminopeptidase YwaD
VARPVKDDYFQHFELRFQLVNVRGTNVVGYLPGNDPALKDEYIVIGAHYDHLGYVFEEGEKVIFSGADDNASGTAVLIELARRFSQNRDTFGRSLIFIAFDAEESGLIGAGRFISENQVFDPEDMRMMFSLDMVGMYAANRGLHLRGMGTLRNGAGIAQQVADKVGLRLLSTSSYIPMFTDTKPFGDAGIPAAHAFTGLKSPYHQPEDTYEKLDYEGMAKVTEFLAGLVQELSVMPQLKPSAQLSTQRQPRKVRLNFGLVAHLGGSHHKYPDEFFRAKGVFAAGAGVMLQLHIKDRLTLQPEFLYDYNGSKSESGTFRRHALTLPLSLQFNLTNQGGSGARLYPFAGGYYRYTFWGENHLDGANFKDQFDNEEFGISAGFGIDFMRMHLAYTWRRGLTNISKTGDLKFFDTGNYFTIGYKF